jgi:hypothetical protein
MHRYLELCLYSFLYYIPYIHGIYGVCTILTKCLYTAYTRLRYWLILARVLVGLFSMPMAYTLWGYKGLCPIGMHISILLNTGHNKPKWAIFKGYGLISWFI